MPSMLLFWESDGLTATSTYASAVDGTMAAAFLAWSFLLPLLPHAARTAAMTTTTVTDPSNRFIDTSQLVERREAKPPTRSRPASSSCADCAATPAEASARQ